MGTLRDIIDVSKDLFKKGEPKALFNKKAQSRSLSKKASEGTVQFPVIMSSSMDIETAQNISKALERNYATFVQIVFSMDPTLSIEDGKSASDYIMKFHQNMDSKFNDVFDIVKSTNDTELFRTENFVILSGVYEGSTTKIVANNKEQLIDLMDHVRHDILDHKYVPKLETMYSFKNPELNHKYNSMRFEPVSEAVNTKRSGDIKRPSDIIRSDSKVSDYAKGMLTDNDVKKSNELIATTLHIRIKLLTKDGMGGSTIDFIIGVKAIMHVVRSDDMVENMVSVCKNDNAVFNFLRWTTGEISFFKDFLFNISGAKADVHRASHGSSPWWLALKRRRSLAKVTDANVFSKKRILPNATIVISEEEVEMIKSEFGYDLHNPIFVDRVMNSYFLLGFVIVDSSAQIAHFKFDGQDDFQSVTFSALEKANTSDERKFKEMLKVINRI
jgi:hypothetical protein